MPLLLLLGFSCEAGNQLQAQLPQLQVEPIRTLSQARLSLQDKTVALLLVEHNLPEQTGLDFLLKLQQSDLLLPPILYVCSRASELDMSAALTQYFPRHSLLITPFSKEQLALGVEQALSFSGMIEPPEHIQGRLRELWHKHSPGLLKQAHSLAQVTELDLDDESRRAGLVRSAHQLAGTVATFGFPNTSEMARQIENSLLDGNPPAELVARQGRQVYQMLLGGDHT